MLQSSAAPAAPSRGPAMGEQRDTSGENPAEPARALLGMLRRRLWVILLCAAAVPVLAALALHQTPPRYTAAGSLVYDPNEYRPRELQSILRTDPPTEATLGSQAEVLGGLELIERVATALNLFADPAFNAALRQPGALHRILVRLGAASATPVDPASEPARNAVLLAAQQALTVKAEPGSHVLAVSFTAGDPVLAAAVVNRLMDFYVRDQLAAKFRAVRRAQDWLESRAQELREEVRAEEDRIEHYRAQQGMVRGMHAGLDAEQISTITDNLARARGELAQAEGRLEAARGGAGAAALAGVTPSVVDAQQAADLIAAEIRRRAATLGPNHPEMRALRQQLAAAEAAVGAARARVVSATEAEVRAARGRVAALEQDLAAAQARAQTQAEAETPLHAMERDLDASRTLLQSVLDRLQEIRAQAAVESADAREISLALPPTAPSFPRTRPMLAAAGAFGLVFGLMAAYTMDLADTSLGSGEDVRRHLRLRCLALIPRVRRRALRGALLCEHAVAAPMSAFAEQVRALRTGLWLGHERPRIVAVAAARPGEGKTTVVLSLARSAALSGEREPGLGEVLRGAATLEAVLRRDHLTNLDFIPAGDAGPETLSLLMSEAMARLLQQLRADYDFVLMDAPPAHAMADARVIAHLADATLVCARWRATPRAVVQSALEMIEAAGATVVGVALTRVDLRVHRRSGAADAELCHRRYRQYWRV